MTNPRSPGILTHDRLFISSMAGSDPATGKVPDDPAAQVDLALDRMHSCRESRRTGIEPRGFRQSLSDFRNSVAGHERALCQAL